MYLTAQRVRTRDGEEGVNTFFFLHRGVLVPGMSWSAPDVVKVADRYPGKVIVQRLEQEDRFNNVLSFLDVVADDALGAVQLRAALSATDFDPAKGTSWTLGPVSFRFFRASANVRSNADEFRSLREHALLLLRSPKIGITPTRTSQPLKIVAEDQEGLGVVYRLEAETSKRLLHIRPHHTPATLRVAYEDREALVGLWGDEEFHRQIALVLTGLSARDLAGLGDVAVVDLHHHLSPDVIAKSEEIAGQITGDWIAPGEEVSPPTGWPTGALLRAGDCALDLVYIERAWYPLSEAAIHSYPHTKGMKQRERWRFVTRSEPRVIYRVSLESPIMRKEVAATYGDEAATRTRPDHPAVQLRLVEE